MAPRGMKSIISKTAPCKLRGRGRQKSFVTHSGVRLKGLTKALQRSLWSDGSFPPSAVANGVRRRGWRGEDGGRRRGTAIDAQITRIVNEGSVRTGRRLYSLTRLALAALAHRGLDPVACQRAVCDQRMRIATAIDILCLRRADARIVVVELKCGHSGDRDAPARRGARCCRMRGPLSGAFDTTLNRHLAQLSCTRELFVREHSVLARLGAIGVDAVTEADVHGALLYVDDATATFVELTDWWKRRSNRILQAATRQGSVDC